MTAGEDKKAELHRYLTAARETMLWKLDGLSEYDVRRPMVATGTNLLGLIKHLANGEAGYFGQVFSRPFEAGIVVWDEIEEGVVDEMADMWATASESREEIINTYRAACAHADQTIKDLPLEAVGRVPWWPAERAEPSLHKVMVHVIAETNRHAGHADIIRELLDGEAGLRADVSNLPERPSDEWAAYREHLEQIARNAATD